MRAFLLLLALPALGCIEDRLAVEVTTEIHTDGTCHRRIVYHLERTDTARPSERIPIAARDNPLIKLHRFPLSAPWTLSRDTVDLAEIVTVEGELGSPNAIGSDYFRIRHPKARPARNQVSFAMESADGETIYEYSETFVDPASPMAAARQLARVLLKRDDAFAREFLARMEAFHLRRGDVKRVYRESFALPLLRSTSALSARRAYGVHERRELSSLFSEDHFEPALSAGLAALLPGADSGQVASAVDASLEALMPSLETEMSAAGLPMDALFPTFQEARAPIHFTVHLVMPAPITRANTCVNGDTASWEFDGDDLYGRGFEMWAKAAAQ
jgi:hypothetical protein